MLLLFVLLAGSLLAMLPGSSVAVAPLPYHQLAPGTSWLRQPLGVMRDHGRFGEGELCGKLSEELLDPLPKTSMMAHARTERRVLALPVVS